MAGIGVRLNKIFSKKTMTTDLIGFGYSTLLTIAPMLLVIAAVYAMQKLLGISKLDYASRELFSDTVLYIFVFALLTAAPFNAVLSKYLSDVIYEECYADIIACYYVGLLLNLLASCAVGIPFCIREYLVGKVELHFVFAGYVGYIALVLVFYTMLYLSICKDFKKISGFFLVGMLATTGCSVLFVYALKWEKTFSMLAALDVGMLLIACMELAQVKSYFRENSRKYRNVFVYLKRYWKLILANLFYTVGLYLHNFVFWSTDMHMVVADSFVSMPSYDMASFMGMVTNITAPIILIARIEMFFHEKYKAYSEAVIGGRGIDIERARRRMLQQLSDELLSLARIQFAISVVVFFLCITFMPRLGFGGLVIKMYPCLAVGYFILFMMYGAIIYQYYFSDLNGAFITALSFCAVSFLGSMSAAKLTPEWYGLGLISGAFVGWTVAYWRLHLVEKNLDVHIFCNGTIMKKGNGKCPTNLVYDRYEKVRAGKQRRKKR